MRSGREPFLPALAGLAGLLVGVLFTLAVIQFEATFQMSHDQRGSDKTTSTASSPSPLEHWTGNAERYTMLTILLALAVISIVAYLRLVRGASTTTLEKSFEVPAREDPPTRTVLGPANPPASQPGEGRRRDQAENNRGGFPDKGRTRHEPSYPGLQQPSPTPSRGQRETNPPPTMDDSQPTSPPSQPSVSDGLVGVWDNYYRKGGGKFTIRGLQHHLEQAGVYAEVLGGDQINAGENLLIVDYRDGSGLLHILPNFSKPIRALDTWFQTLGSGARTALIQRLVRPATARRKGGQIVLENRGEVE